MIRPLLLDKPVTAYVIVISVDVESRGGEVFQREPAVIEFESYRACRRIVGSREGARYLQKVVVAKICDNIFAAVWINKSAPSPPVSVSLPAPPQSVSLPPFP